MLEHLGFARLARRELTKTFICNGRYVDRLVLLNICCGGFDAVCISAFVE